MPQIHSTQIQGSSGFQSLYEQLKIIYTPVQNVDIEYLLNDTDDVIGEVVWDMASPTNPIEIKRIEYNYDTVGNIVSEILTVGGRSFKKTYLYTGEAITREIIREIITP